MTAFRRLHRLASFRDAFGSLLNLDTFDFDTVVDAVRRSGDDPDATDLVRDDLGPAYSALAVLRRIASEESASALIEDVGAAYLQQQDLVARLAKHLDPTNTERDLQEIIAAETSTLPIVLDGEVVLDFRVSQRSREVKLIPLFVARIVFDEEVAGGSEVVTFQASPSDLERLRDKINDALDSLPMAARAIGSKLLHEQTARKFL